MKHLLSTPVRRIGQALGAAALLGVALSAPAATVSYEGSFGASGGDARTGNGDTDTVLNVPLAIPFFDPMLGTLQKVGFELSGWRSLDLVCTAGGDVSYVGCNAGIDITFSLYVPEGASSRTLGLINPQVEPNRSYVPAQGTAVADRLYDEDQLTGEILASDFLALMTADGVADAFWLRLQGYDGGSFGFGGTSYFSSMLYDADATVRITYDYTPAGGDGQAVPEPAPLGLMCAGGLALWLTRRSRKTAETPSSPGRERATAPA